LARLRAHDVQLINEEPQLSGDGRWRYAFIHPSSTGGVLIELYESQDGEREGDDRRPGRG
jgi:hypothetical protein